MSRQKKQVLPVIDDNRTAFGKIIMLEEIKNKKGDKFTRLVYDVIHALGFGEPKFDVPRSGREIDTIVKHRTERKYALVECKAQKSAVGGDDINKFVGAMDVEAGRYEKDGNSVVGYFISQVGFTQTAVEQEHERAEARRSHGDNREVVLLGPKEISEELVRGNVLCSLERAAETVGRTLDATLSICKSADLVACEYGWIWVLYYSACPEQGATHFTFVHADGNRLLNGIADKLIQKARAKKEPFADLEYIKAPDDAETEKEKARIAYFNYLKNELGEIQFEGMPTDRDASSIKVNLEGMFVPLKFSKIPVKGKDGEYSGGARKTVSDKYITIDKVITTSPRAAILAKPGGGKSTLIRRMALAYAFPERRKKVGDKLPDIDFFPVYIRCRDLGSDALKSVSDIIATIVQRAEIAHLKTAFTTLVGDMLQAGKVLLLVDGLDEISDERHRIAFVGQLRTFIATYPTAHLIVTSREAGFRAVANTITSYCEQYSIAPLEPQAIRTLCLNWHKAILGESQTVESESDKVCDLIVNDGRIIALATNPLLLTTLLFVKRSVGYIPTKKDKLYEEMIKLLLVTWNSAAHYRLEIDETEPQLAYVAYRMTVAGQQKITRDKLEKYIAESRKTLPAILGYTNISPLQFVDRVEERSSLLIQFGLEEDSRGKYVQSYEFSHLSFQEYLTAKAVTENWISSSDIDILEIIKPYMFRENWKEVIPLIAVQARRQAKPIIEYLIATAENGIESRDNRNRSRYDYSPAYLLANCIAGEVQMERDILEHAIKLVIQNREFIKTGAWDHASGVSADIFSNILNSKYGNIYKETVADVFFGGKDVEHIYDYSECWMDIYGSENGDITDINKLGELLRSDDFKDKVTAALYLMRRAYYINIKGVGIQSRLRAAAAQEIKKTVEDSSIFESVYELLSSGNEVGVFAATWCVAWAGCNESDIIPHGILSKILNKCVELWLSHKQNTPVRRSLSWAIYSCCYDGADKEHIGNITDIAREVELAIDKPYADLDARAAVSLGVMLNIFEPAKHEEQIKRALTSIPQFDISPYLNSVEYVSKILDEIKEQSRDAISA